jgi:uncharacterized protein
VTFFVDANVIVYARLEGPLREACLRLLGVIARGDTDGRTSPAVLEEVWHLELSGKAGDLSGLTERAYTIFSPLVPVTDEAFQLALRVEAPHVGANDRVHAGTCRANRINLIASADPDFDLVPGLQRADPADERAWQMLLTSD